MGGASDAVIRECFFIQYEDGECDIVSKDGNHVRPLRRVSLAAELRQKCVLAHCSSHDAPNHQEKLSL